MNTNPVWASQIGRFFVRCEVVPAKITDDKEWRAVVHFRFAHPTPEQNQGEDLHILQSRFEDKFEAIEVARMYAREVVVRHAVRL